MSARASFLRRLAFGLLTTVILFAVLTARVLFEGEEEMRKSDAAFDRGNLRDSILYARRAAVLYAPGAPHVKAAYARLEAIAIGAEGSGQKEVAREAWGAVRAAAIESRHLLSPHAAELERANASLARLELSAGRGDRAHAARLLARDDAPRAPWILVLGLGFSLFSAGLLAFTRAVGADGHFSRRVLGLSVLLAVAGAACWTLAIYRA